MTVIHEFYVAMNRTPVVLRETVLEAQEWAAVGNDWLLEHGFHDREPAVWMEDFAEILDIDTPGSARIYQEVINLHRHACSSLRLMAEHLRRISYRRSAYRLDLLASTPPLLESPAFDPELTSRLTIGGCHYEVVGPLIRSVSFIGPRLPRTRRRQLRRAQ